MKVNDHLYFLKKRAWNLQKVIEYMKFWTESDKSLF